MNSEILLLASFLLFMLFFAGVGLASMFVKEDTTDDYLVAGRGMHPALAALSAVSTWNSGYMFIGFIGFIFVNGYSAIWILLSQQSANLSPGFGFTSTSKKKVNNEGYVRSLRWYPAQPVLLKQRLPLFFQLFSCRFMRRHNSLPAELHSKLCSIGLQQSVFSSVSSSWSLTATLAEFVPQYGPMRPSLAL